MLHLTGAALLLAASALLRRAILSRARQQRQTLRVLSDGFLSLAQSVRATLTPFPALLETVPREGAAGMFFSSVRARLARGETLSDAWRTAAEALPLPERERSAVASLASALGGEEESVCAALALSARELTAADGELRQQAREQSRITAALCLGGGVMLCILLM